MERIAKRKRVTIGDIAKEIGVSKTTVSRAINNKGGILPETRDKILKLIDKYNYQPSALAKGISSNKSKTIGVFIPHEIDYVFLNPFYDEIIRAIFKEAENLGYYILLIYCHNENYLDIIYQDRIDGLMVISPGLNHREIIENIKKTGIPFVLTSRMPGEVSIPHVCVNNYSGARKAVEHLVSLGHKDIAFINGPNILSSSADRYRGYREVMEENGLPIRKEFNYDGENNIESGYRIMKKMLDNPPSAVFVSGDFMAFGAMNAVQEAGMKIPEDISFVGFDDITMARVMNPPLTTVNQSTLEKGQLGVKLLVDLINGSDIEITNELGVELVIRKSTGPCSTH